MDVATMTYDEFKALPQVVETYSTVDPVTHHTIMHMAKPVLLLVEAWWRDREEDQVYEIGFKLEDNGHQTWMRRRTSVFGT